MFMCTWHDQPLVLRRLGPPLLSMSSTQELHEQTLLLGHLHHPHITKVIGFATDKAHNHGVLIERVPRSLYDILQSSQSQHLTWANTWLRACVEVCEGLAYLHSQGVAHCCFRPQNVMVDDQFSVKISDFGRSERAVSIVCTESRNVIASEADQAYSAPELLRMERFDAAVDCWSFGCLIARIGSRLPLYHALGDTTFYAAMIMVSAGQVSPVSALEDAEDCPPEMMELASRCTSLDPSARPSFARICAALPHVKVAAKDKTIPVSRQPTRSAHRRESTNRRGVGRVSVALPDVPASLPAAQSLPSTQSLPVASSLPAPGLLMHGSSRPAHPAMSHRTSRTSSLADAAEARLGASQLASGNSEVACSTARGSEAAQLRKSVSRKTKVDEPNAPDEGAVLGESVSKRQVKAHRVQI